ncbi:MAG TPA: ABC transporter substrate-binding protein [Nocardioidaceae bacterium]|nr:ABC transporter substrate-binding protein [Nocardioidaceae bacterium]
MRRKHLRSLGAIAVVAALTLSACGDDGGNGGGNGGGGATPEFNGAVGAVFNASDKTGGTLKMGKSGDWGDSVDPGDTYYGYSWNLLRGYGRALTMFKVAPGKESEELVGDLAEDLGTPSEGGKTWTYTLREGLVYEDGTAITSADVAYAVTRAFDREVFPNGPEYFNGYLDYPADYKGPYKTPEMDISSAIETPDERTIVFHLKAAYAGFDYFAMTPQTVPVPKDKDTGTKYKEHVISSGPYMWESWEAGKKYVLVRNPEWDPATDPNRNPLVDRIEIELNLNAEDVDNRILDGDLHVDVAGTGVQPATLPTVLNDEEIKAKADNPGSARTWYTSIIPTVKPLDNIDCRKAVMLAMDRSLYQAAYGGPLAGGDIATSMLPPTIPGHIDFDPYDSAAEGPDVEGAKAALADCGQPDGFDTNIAYRTERPKEQATAEGFQQALKAVGINLTLKPLAEGTYFSDTVGKPSYLVENNIGLATNGWSADWNDGFGFFSQIVDSRVIRPTGGSSNLSVRVPEIDALLDTAIGELDTATREGYWGEIDELVMAEAVVYPGIYSKALTLRGDGITNVFVNEAFGQYDYISMGVE